MAYSILSSKKKPMIVLNGFLYVQHSKSKNGEKQYWRCYERDRCNARCTTDGADFTQVISDGTKKHTHPETKAEIAAKAVVQRIKRHAEDHPTEHPSKIVAVEIENEDDDEVLAHLPERENLRRFTNRTQNRTRPANPTNLAELHISPPYDVTKKGEKFFFYDSGEGEENRVIIFTTERNLRYLCNSPIIFSNGTFKTAPDMFVQLFTVHGLYRNHLFPFVYALTTNKDENSYNTLYRELKRICAEYNLVLSPTTMMSDFELANINASERNFPGVIIKLCLFHLNQSIWRQVEQNGLKTDYTENPQVRHAIQHLLGLAFVPLEDVEEVFNDIMEDDLPEAVLSVYETVEKTYVTGTPARGRRRAVPPRYPPAKWNVYQAVIHNEHRTNNMVEGYHNKFQKAIQVIHSLRKLDYHC